MSKKSNANPVILWSSIGIFLLSLSDIFALWLNYSMLDPDEEFSKAQYLPALVWILISIYLCNRIAKFMNESIKKRSHKKQIDL